jgi:hypothetical protein
MKNILLILLLSSASLIAQIPTKLEILKDKKEKAVANIEQIYEQELKKLLLDPHIKNNLAESTKIQLEIDKFDKKPEAEVAEDLWFVDKVWITPAGTRFVFEKNRKVIRKFNNDITKLSWERSKVQGVIIVKGEFNDSGNSKEKFFNFDDQTNPLYGNNISDMRTIKYEQ